MIAGSGVHPRVESVLERLMLRRFGQSAAVATGCPDRPTSGPPGMSSTYRIVTKKTRLGFLLDNFLKDF
jgi:hypothetical protein